MLQIIGWSKIKNNGEEVYVATRLLSSEEPDMTEENVVNNEVTNENVVNNETSIQNKTEMELIREEVGVLPEVGKNISVTIYRIICLLTIVLSAVLYGIYLKINTKEQ